MSKDSTGIPYSVKESHRAKYVRLKVLASGELQVVIPLGYDQRRIPEILQRKQDWIKKTTDRVQTERPLLGNPLQPPSQIALLAIAETWQVVYYPTSASGVTALERQGKCLAIRGNVEHTALCHDVLRRWLKGKAYKHLGPWLQRVSHQTQLPFQKVSVRGQKTLWASCSQNHAISLNYKLLFLPDPLVHYVLVHELCHTVHLNHSDAFWGLVETRLPDYQQRDRELRTASRYIPTWVMQE